MKKTTLHLLFLFVGTICLLSCKKKDKNSAEEPVVPPVVTNPPPTTGDYWLTIKNNSTICWTQDFVSYHELSTALKGDFIYLSGDTALFTGYQDHSIKYGPVSNPSIFKTITSSRFVNAAAYINGYMVAYSVEGNNKYIGYCNSKKGETSIQYMTLDNGESFNGFYKIRNTLVTNFSTSLGTTLAFTSFSNDSLKWVLAPSPSANSSFQYFDGGSGVTVAYNGWFYKSNGTDLKTAAWSVKDIPNTTDSLGSFEANFNIGSFTKINDKWKIYGTVNMTNNNHELHAVNISTDQGESWQTTLLTGIPFVTHAPPYFGYKHLASKNTTFMMCSTQNGSNSIAYIYKSNDGINFTKILEGVEAENLFVQSLGAVYVK